MSRTQPHVAVVGGVTGGHLYPGLAVAHELRRLRPNIRLTFLGTGREWERVAVVSAQVGYHPVESAPSSRSPRKWLDWLKANISGYRAAKRFLQREQVSALLGLGGYASLPAGTAACRLQLPLVLLEPNAIAGRANLWLSRRATRMCVAFPEIACQMVRPEIIRVTGTPVRRQFFCNELSQDQAARFGPEQLIQNGKSGSYTRACNDGVRPEIQPPTDRRRQLLVLGGSQGASRLNHAVPRALGELMPLLDSWSVVHIAGPRSCPETSAQYAKFHVPAVVLPYAADLPSLLPQCDLVVSRGGGATLAELAACGVPAVICPYPHAKDDHQRCNAEAYARAGACGVIEEFGPFHSSLVSILAELLTCNKRRDEMAQAMQQSARPHAARHVAQILLESAEGSTAAAGHKMAPCSVGVSRQLAVGSGDPG